jgi:hypothetical protein
VNGSLKMQISLDYPSIPSSHYLEGPLHALVEIGSEPRPITAERPPLNLVVVIDSSATMHHFHLTDEEREYWMGVAISRDELERGLTGQGRHLQKCRVSHKPQWLSRPKPLST